MSVAESIQFHVEHQEGRDMRVFDPSLGYAYTIGMSGSDGIMYDILNSPIGRRSLDVCQLSKSALDDTIQGLEGFRRFQHIAGVYETVRHFCRQQRLDPETALKYALVASLTDLPHGVKSHSTDIMIEGVGGVEQFHETRLDQALAFGGPQEVFSKHNFRLANPAAKKIEEMLGIHVPSWVENKKGEPNSDNLNYIAGESRIWFPSNELVLAATSLDAIEINELGQFVFKDHDLARVWGKLGLLLSSEHWNEPVNRLVELLSVETIKRIIFNRYLNGIDEIDNGQQAIPEDYTFFCDTDFDSVLKATALSKHNQDGFMTAAYFMLETLGFNERARFEAHKKPAYEEFLADHGAREYPSAYVNPHVAQFGPLPVFVEVLGDRDKERAEAISGRGRLLTDDGEPIGYLKNFKIRQYDPLVKDRAGNVKHLSEVDPVYASLLDQHRQAIVYTSAMKLLMNRSVKQTFCQALKENEGAMSMAHKREHSLSPDQLRRVIKGAGTRATALAINRGMWKEI